MSGSDGISRLRKAVDNQASLGEAAFTLPIGEMLTMLDECEDELAALAWAKGVPAPVDADGNVVPLTTGVMYFGDSPRDVIGFHYNADNGWELYTTTLYTLLSTFNLRRPDSWERLEEDSKLAPRDYLQGRGMSPDKTERVKAMAIDIVKRAKALAERDAKEAGRGK